MGTDVEVILNGGDESLLDLAEARIENLESRWSRFRASSELESLNHLPDRRVILSRESFEIIELAVAASLSTKGAFDPTVYDAIRSAGYLSDFEGGLDTPAASDGSDSERAALPLDTTSAKPAPGCGSIILDPIVRSVMLPEGVHIDLGGIGKGRAADLVAIELMNAGARGVCVSLGGDLRVIGDAPPADSSALRADADGSPENAAAISSWSIGVQDSPGLVIALAAGGIATSARTRRIWSSGGETRHHLIDPRSGQPSQGSGRSVTVIAKDATSAEVLAKALYFLDPKDGAEVLNAHNATGVIIDDDGQAHPLSGFERFLA
ncbi:membrane-associated lipoprotein involved in thiamine biosynthesis [Actinobacteria bacterium IMCC26256]|nr:membrane-associated lipoprotein involved in thiamine biosynthesis [Actinobacteria bacterium IMCC26256]